MGDAMDISLGIVLGGFVFLFGVAGTLNSLSGYITTIGLKNHQTIRGSVVDENYTSNFWGSMYQVSIRTTNGRKVLVDYTSNVSGYEPQALNTLFAKGDIVELDVGTNQGFDGTQRFVGLAGRLVEDKTK
jgi:hypothetical protein